MPFDPSGPPDPPAPSPGVDPFVDDLVEDAAAPYAGLVGPERLAAMKDELRMFLIADPRASRIVDRARPRSEDRSGKRLVAGHASPAARKAEGKPR